MTGPPTPEMRAAFRDALVEAVNSRSRPASVAERLSVSTDLVRKWMSGTNLPAPLSLFEVERFLSLNPGELSRHLGYVPAGSDTSVPQAIEADPRLDDVSRRMLIGAYKQAVRHA